MKNTIFLLKLKALKHSGPRTAASLEGHPVFRDFIEILSDRLSAIPGGARCDLPFALDPSDNSTIPVDWASIAARFYSAESLIPKKHDPLLAIRAARWIARCIRMIEFGPSHLYPNEWNLALADGRIQWIAASLIQRDAQSS